MYFDAAIQPIKAEKTLPNDQITRQYLCRRNYRLFWYALRLYEGITGKIIDRSSKYAVTT